MSHCFDFDRMLLGVKLLQAVEPLERNQPERNRLVCSHRYTYRPCIVGRLCEESTISYRDSDSGGCRAA
jgi:hypothetical protein